MLNRFLKLKVFQKVILVFLVLTIPVYVISLSINLVSIKYVKIQIADVMTSKVKFYSGNLTDETDHIKNQQWQLLNMGDLLKLRYLSKTLEMYDLVQLLNSTNEKLTTVKNSSPYIEDVKVYIKSLGKIISTKGGVYGITEGEKEILREYFSDPSNLNLSIFQYGDRLFFMEPFSKSALKKQRDIDDIIVVELSVSKIKETLLQLGGYKGLETMLVNPKTGFCIFPYNDDATRFMPEAFLTIDHETMNGNYVSKVINGQRYWLLHDRINHLNMELVAYIPENQVTGVLKKYDVLFITIAMVSIISIFIFALLIDRMIHKPISEIVNAFKSLEAENLDIEIRNNGNDEFGYLYRAFNNVVSKLKVSIREVYEQKIAAQQLELKQLQSQINPHFLYNCFFHIYRMCKFEDYENVAMLTQKLGSYFQFITRSGADMVPFRMELKHAKDYVDIQNIRFSNRIMVDFTECPRECMENLVPRLILQPIIENVYEHGFENKIEGGVIRVDVTYKNKLIYIVIEDNGDGMDDEALKALQNKLADTNNAQEKTGIVNVSRRINLKYGEQSGLRVNRSPLGGVKVEVFINFMGEENYV